MDVELELLCLVLDHADDVDLGLCRYPQNQAYRDVNYAVGVV